MVDGYRLDHFRGGNGDPLVLLHGMFQSRHSWSPVLDRLTPERDLLALTHLGHAGSPSFSAGQPATIAAWTDAVEAELDAAGFDRPDVVGHSLGGWIAMELAKRGRARSIVALAPAGEYTDQEVAKLAKWVRRNHRASRRLLPLARRVVRTRVGRKLVLGDACAHASRIPPEEAERLLVDFATCPDPEGFVGALRHPNGVAIFLEEVEQVRCPVLILVPERDRFFTRAVAERFVSALPHATAEMLPDCGHTAMFDHPDLISSTILDFSAASQSRTARHPHAAPGPGTHSADAPAHHRRVEDLQARGARVEYWFFKFNLDGLAFLVDFIVRRHRDEAEVRPSLWIDRRGRIEHAVGSSWNTSEPFVSVGDCHLGSGSTRGAVDDIEWDLSYELGRARVEPTLRLFRWLRPLDLQVISRPRARFAGSVRVGERRFTVPETDGLVSHYWGRRLWDGWWWISANQFGESGVAVEASVGRSRLWGLPWPPMKSGYLWLDAPGGSQRVLSPLNGLIGVTGDLERFTVAARSITGRTVRLHCTATMDHYNDLGEEIRQTLLGTCVIEGLATASGTAGLEHRL